MALGVPHTINAVSQHGKGFGGELELGGTGILPAPGPAESPLLQPLGQQPETAAVPIQHLEPRVVPVAKHKERPAAQLLLQALSHQCRQALNPPRQRQARLRPGLPRRHTCLQAWEERQFVVPGKESRPPGA